MGNGVSQAVDKLFDERRDFIIIGLTGRTGAGCSTVAKILQTDDFKDLCLPKPKNCDFNSNEERKYKVIYNYCEKHWCKFKVIEMRSVITSFILEEDYDKFYGIVTANIEDKYKSTVCNILNEKVKKEYNNMHNKRIDIKTRVDENEDNLKDNDIYEFYFNTLPDFTNLLKNYFDSIDKNIYTKLYQLVANNIRTSGSAYEDKFIAENIWKLSQRTNALIKILRKRNKIEKGRVLVVIDSLRNPYESTFFKDRYSSFYLVSINVDQNSRESRLYNIGYTKDEINNIDKIEYPSKYKGEDKYKIFSNQNIQQCTELADIHIYNEQDDIDFNEIKQNDFVNLKKKIIKYITLIMHPGIITPTHIERTMQMAYNAKMSSGCISRQVGAVVTDNKFSIKSVGWNTVAEGQIPCNLRDLYDLVNGDDLEAFSKFELKNTDFTKCCSNELSRLDKEKLHGRLYPYCFKDIYSEMKKMKKKDGEKEIIEKNPVHTRSLHAEENAFLQVCKYGGISLEGGFLFTTASPCELCAKKAYQLGIEEIYYIDPYPGVSENHILECGVRRPKMILFDGVIGRAYTQLYMQIIPYKDEISYLLD